MGGACCRVGVGTQPCRNWVLVSSLPTWWGGNEGVVREGRGPGRGSQTTHRVLSHPQGCTLEKKVGGTSTLPVVLQSAANLPLSLNLSISRGGRDCHPIPQMGKRRLEAAESVPNLGLQPSVPALCTAGPLSPAQGSAGVAGQAHQSCCLARSEAGGVWR